jgi:hypothetical protein
MKKRAFLAPLALSIAALLGSSPSDGRVPPTSVAPGMRTRIAAVYIGPSNADFVLGFGGTATAMLGHSSHSSHSSHGSHSSHYSSHSPGHSSHASHSSHSSHYSGS